MKFNLSPTAKHLLKRNPLPYSLEFFLLYDFTAIERVEKDSLNDLHTVTISKAFGELKLNVNYTFDLSVSEDLFETTIELEINNEFVEMNFANHTDFFNFVYALFKGFITK
jgi:hypothetical protein